MLKKVYQQCYDVCDDRTEYKVRPEHCLIDREYCFGGRIWIGNEKPECTQEDMCEFYVNGSFENFYNRLQCNYGCKDVVYCPGKSWKCPVMETCIHNNVQVNEDYYITPKFVGDDGCIYFKEMV